MRDAYYDQLRAIVDDVVALTSLVRRSLASATLALLDADRTLAEQVIADDDRIDQLTNDIEGRSFLIMATQQPVAGDLRQLVATMRIIADLERMGDLAVHVAKVARMREPVNAVPEELQATIRSMGQVADAMIAAASHIVAKRDVEAAHELERKDDEMDMLHRELFRTLLSDSWAHGVEAAVDVALLSRYYERIGDHAVSLARRMIFQVTGTRELV
ncbi:MAG TPA: phosphate signaling complex protein PhoU [Aeromicrobium sp.]|nr:phosphate signaling complex protein PhoU [Aeromicrobium sp.]